MARFEYHICAKRRNGLYQQGTAFHLQSHYRSIGFKSNIKWSKKLFVSTTQTLRPLSDLTYNKIEYLASTLPLSHHYTHNAVRGSNGHELGMANHTLQFAEKNRLFLDRWTSLRPDCFTASNWLPHRAHWASYGGPCNDCPILRNQINTSL